MKQKLNFVVERKNCDWALIQRNHDMLLFIPHEKFLLKHISFLKSQGFELQSKIMDDMLIFIKKKHQPGIRLRGAE